MASPDWTQLSTVLDEVDFPCDRASLVRQATAAGAGDPLVGHLHSLPDKSFADAAAVLRACRSAP